MRHVKALLPFSALLIFMLLACQLSGGTATAPANATATSVLNGATPLSSGGTNTFTSAENGVVVQYPQGWITEPPASGDQSVVTFISPDQAVHSVLYVFPTQSGDTAQTVNESLAQSALNGLTDIQVVSDGALTRPDGNEAWSKVVTATYQGSSLMINLTTIINGSHSFFLMSFGIDSSFTANSIDVSALINGVSFVAPVVSGVDRSQALFLEGGESTNPRDYDPATEHDSGDKRVYSGLVSLDAKLNITPELAESWDLSSDGTVYTFHIRANAKFHDGRAVTAQDVIYSWERAALPATESDTVLTYLGDIVGVAEVHSGKADHISGLKALDEHTLQVTIDAPKVYFLYKLTMPVAFVLDESNVESGSEWYRSPNGTGPYKLSKWDRFKLMVYDANPDFYLGPPSIPQVVVQIYTGSGIRLYQTGDIDITGVSYYDAQTVQDPANSLHPDLLTSPSLCTSYVVFDVTKPPFDDLKVRQAFSMAFDKQKFIDVANNGVGIAAKGLYPPALPGYSLNLQGLPYDPEQARKLLSESKYGGAQGLPPIVYTEGGIGDSTGSDVDAMIAMWQQNLGVTISVQNIESNKYSDLLFSGQHGQLFTWGWCADYPDPENFADVLFHSGAQQNLGSYSNPALDAILDQARVEKDVNARISLYQQAEAMIVQDAPAIFIMHDIEYLLVKPYVKGYVLTPISIPIERYLWIQH
jgi:oligopeptide transport system substrate-binding protein